MKEIYLAIVNALESIGTIRWIDFDLGQLDVEHPPVSFPCALIRFNDIEYTDLADNIQQGEMSIGIRMAFKLYERTHSKGQRLDYALKHLDIIRHVHKALQGLDGDFFSPFVRRGFSTEERADYRVYEIAYHTIVTDDPADIEGGGNTNTKTYVKFKDLSNEELEFCPDTTITTTTETNT